MSKSVTRYGWPRTESFLVWRAQGMSELEPLLPGELRENREVSESTWTRSVPSLEERSQVSEVGCVSPSFVP